jgi:hypothetical protein
MGSIIYLQGQEKVKLGENRKNTPFLTFQTDSFQGET